MNQLSTKDVMLLEDTLKVCENMTKFISSAANTCTDPQLKSLWHNGERTRFFTNPGQIYYTGQTTVKEE